MTTKFLLQDPDLFRQQAYIGGRWCDADNGATAEVNNPATGEILGTVPIMGRAETAGRSNQRNTHGPTGVAGQRVTAACSCASGTT